MTGRRTAIATVAASSAALILLAACGDAADTSGPLADPVATVTDDPVDPVATGTTGEDDAELETALSDVGLAAPQLESFLRGGEYPTDVAGAESALEEAGIELTDGNTVGAYRYDSDAVEFILCVRTPSGAWATYDTAPMTVGDQGTSGGCPDL